MPPVLWHMKMIRSALRRRAVYVLPLESIENLSSTLSHRKIVSFKSSVVASKENRRSAKTLVS